MRKKTRTKVAAGTAVGALVAAAAGAAIFFTQTKAGKQAAQKIKKHAAELGKKVAHKVEKAKKLTQKKYEELVDEVVDDYAKKKKLAKSTSAAVKKDLKSHWKEVRRELKK